ncbi:hypothetical protein PRK78_006508 [Emydomyces testavorans]|uniref:Rho-GAP domain-containing protein n=1 Tax=Emydomyces testavorans TaxID=2070801 RepID=A0AAF0INP0_9EURO|nr:hypothetical protein PRK78_006508 [Emydomyces testavorans]
MGLAQARQYLSRLYRRAPKGAALGERKSDGSEIPLTIPPVTLTLAERTKNSSTVPESLDLDVADQLLVQRSRQNSNHSNPSVGNRETPKKGDSTTPRNVRLDIPSPDHAASNLSISQTPRSHGLVPAKKLRPSPKAEALLLDAKKKEDTVAARNPSNQSVLSEKSNTTVHHDPSKRCQSPIAVLDTILSESTGDPFSDSHEIGQDSKDSSHRRSLQTTACGDNSTELGSSEEFPEAGAKRDVRRLAVVPAASSRNRVDFRLVSNSSDRALRRILEGTDIARREFARSKAFLAFNSSAPYFDLETLSPPRNNMHTMLSGADPPILRQRSSFLHRIRTARSTLTIRKKNSVKGKLRHMKTLASLASQYRPGSLRGKSLEDLSRLGGESILSKLPPRYFPGALKLPTCIAATVSALLNHGTAIPFIHSELGNEEFVNTLYSYYAGQVLGAEKLKEKINKTMRPIDLPLEHINARGCGGGNDYMHVISTVLRQFLDEIPGGILGSMRLYHALETIYENGFSPINSRHDPGQKDYLPNLPPSPAAKVRMIALAIMAMTTDAQFELVCSIFGLLAVTADESHVLKEFHWNHLHPKTECDRCEGLTNSIQLGEDFGHLLYGVRDPEPAPEFKMGQAAHAAGVITMLIDLWKDISQQFWRWEVIDS